MEISVNDISSVEKELTVTVSKDIVEKEHNKIVSTIAKKAAIKGFRRGKAPKSLVEKVYPEKIREDLLSKLLDSTYEKAVAEQGLKPITQPRIAVEKFENGEDFVYKIIIELLPEFEPADFTGFQLTRKGVTVDDSDVDSALKELRAQQATFKEAPDGKEIQDSDMVLFDFKGSLSNGELIKGGEIENYSIIIGSQKLIPGFEDNLIGMKKGDENDFVLTFPDNYFEKEYAGQDVKFQIKINEIKLRELPELDDNFAKDTGHDTLDELKSFVRKRLTSKKEHESRQDLREQVIEELIKRNEFDVPGSIVKSQIDAMVEETKQRLQGSNADAEQNMRENFKEIAAKIVKKDLIMMRIIKKESLEATASELESKYEEIAKSMNKPVDEVKSYYKKLKAEPRLKEEILSDKVFDMIIEKAEVKEA